MLEAAAHKLSTKAKPRTPACTRPVVEAHKALHKQCCHLPGTAKARNSFLRSCFRTRPEPKHDTWYLRLQALLTAMRLATSAKQTWVVANSAIAIWNTYLPNLQQQRYAPLLDLLISATIMLLTQPDVELLAPQLTGLVTAGALAAEHAALLALLASVPAGDRAVSTAPDSAAPGSASAEPQPNAKSLQEARKLAAPVLSATASAAATAVPAAKQGKGAAKTDTASGLVPVQAMAQLKAAAEACEAVMSKLSSASNAAGWPRCWVYCHPARLWLLNSFAVAVACPPIKPPEVGWSDSAC